ncbi:hypothetical protein [uncultured Rikenella sp.]|uniref:hypothetical protein n=1 Tax=uncultured Rikenella sp. TaxID=368003 RepID=UPI0025F9402C|nr:hypothetical protein [uncultured Rikenella sp.]
MPLGINGKDPAPGRRGYEEGALWGNGSEGSVWSGSPHGTGSVYLRFVMGAIQSNLSSGRAHGFQLRCLSE